MTEKNHREPQPAEGAAYRWALRATLIAQGILAAVALPLAGLTRGEEGVLGALAGVSLATLAALVTQASMVVGYRRAPHVFASIVGGAWLAKMAVILVGLLLLGRVAGIDRPSFGIVALVGIVVTLVVDVLAVRRARISYTHSGSDGADS